MTDEESRLEMARLISKTCQARVITVSVAESCTGGLVGHLLTGVAGSSGYFVGGAIAYSDELKERVLDVPRQTLMAHGAVSAQVALAMAEGARAAFSTDLAVSVTGIAGPDGGSEAKPVGLTYVAVAGPGRHDLQRFVWSGDRLENKLSSAEAALRMLLEAVTTAPLPEP